MLIAVAVTIDGVVLADLTGERPNCYFEAGYAHALGKQLILTIRKGEPKPVVVTLTRAVSGPRIARTSAEPGPFAVMIPLWVTATATGCDDSHRIDGLGISSPLKSNAEAATTAEAPMAVSVSPDALTLIDSATTWNCFVTDGAFTGSSAPGTYRAYGMVPPTGT